MVAQSNPGGRPLMLIILCFGCAFAELEALAENVPRPASARKTPVRTVNRPIKTRRLKKADREADFFFMNDCMWMEFKCEARFVAEPPLPPSTLFPALWCDSPGFYWVRKRFASFFYTFLNHGLHGSHRFQKTRSRDLSIPAALESYQLLTISYQATSGR